MRRVTPTQSLLLAVAAASFPLPAADELAREAAKRGDDDEEERSCPSCGAVVGDPREIDCSSASWPEVVDEEDEPHEAGCECFDCEVNRG